MNKLLFEGYVDRNYDIDAKRCELAKDPIIVAFLESHNIDIKDIDRLSLLEEYKESENICRNCSSLTSCRQKMRGMKIKLIYDSGILYDELDECHLAKEERSKEAFLSNILYSDIPARSKYLTLASISKDYDPEQINSQTVLYYNLVKASVLKRKRGFYIYGDLGVGKTYLSIAFINTMAKKGYKCAFLKVNDFINKMRRYISLHSDEYDMTIEMIKGVPFLVIDDLGTETISAYSRDDLLFNILDHRMENDIFTIFTSNINIEELQKVFTYDKNFNQDTLKAKRLIERIRYLGEEYNLNGENMRLKSLSL